MKYKTIRISEDNWQKLEQLKTTTTFDDVLTDLLNKLEVEK